MQQLTAKTESVKQVELQIHFIWMATKQLCDQS